MAPADGTRPVDVDVTDVERLVCGPFSMLYVPPKLIAPAAAIADNVVAHRSLLDAAIVCDVLIFLAEIVMAAVLYTLFRAVSPTISMAAAFARLGQAGVMAVTTSSAT